MNELMTLTRKDLQLLVLDKTSLIVTFALPIALIALIGSVFGSSFINVGISSYDYAFSKVMFWGLLGGVASSVASIAIEKNSGTIVRLQLSPISKFQMLLGKALACITTMMVSSVLSWLFATLLFDVKTNSYWHLSLVLISNSVFFAGLMTFLANFVKTERAAGALSWTVAQLLACFSGIMFPVVVMPPWMVSAINFNPLMWAVKAMEIALWKDVPFNEILLPLAIPMVAGIVLFSVSVFIFRWSYKQD
ncbi:MAG TPA: ABC transporter permease [Chryseolinea sp.]|nr:ABC transporter permease [Chryseolinea sp.]HPH47329.1 ABC transporter permease [Chryseolinea sp.]HPM31638.1 ABC transporter permease [Chryseolinea sp.]